MEKQDLTYSFVAVGVILIIALVIKPVITGEPQNWGISFETTVPTPEPDATLPIITPGRTKAPTLVVTTIQVPSIPRTISPTDISFVDPSTYGITMEDSISRGSRIYDRTLNTTMVRFGSIAGTHSGTTNVIEMPFPYWELWYTVEPLSVFAATTTKSTATPTTPPVIDGRSMSGYSGSYSDVRPTLTIQVMDGDDPNRIVRIITPPGGINPALWTTGATAKVTATQTKSGSSAPLATPTLMKVEDPRPWKETFYEGERKYFFIVSAAGLESYRIDIYVPVRYLGETD